MLGVLEVALRRHPVAGDLGVARQRLVLVDDLLRRAAHLAVGPRALEDAVDDVAHARRGAVVVVVAGCRCCRACSGNADLFDGLMP